MAILLFPFTEFCWLLPTFPLGGHSHYTAILSVPVLPRQADADVKKEVVKVNKANKTIREIGLDTQYRSYY